MRRGFTCVNQAGSFCLERVTRLPERRKSVSIARQRLPSALLAAKNVAQLRHCLRKSEGQGTPSIGALQKKSHRKKKTAHLWIAKT
jgi:hypothetical protein